MDIHKKTVESIMDKVDVLVNYVEMCLNAEGGGVLLPPTQEEMDALKLLPCLMDECQRAFDEHPPWRT